MRQIILALPLILLAGPAAAQASNPSSGPATAITLAPGFTKTIGTQNGGSDKISATGTLNGQLWPVNKASSYVVSGTDTGSLLIANGASITFTLPNPGASTKGVTYQFGSDGTNGYTLTTAGGTATFYGCTTGAGATSPVFVLNHDVQVVDDGSNYKCSELIGLNGTTTFKTGATNTLLIGQWLASTSYNAISLNGSLSGTAGITIAGGGGGDTTMFLNVPTTGLYSFRVNNVVVSTLDASTLTLSAIQLNVSAMTQTSAVQSGTVCYNSGTGNITYDASLGCLSSTMRIKRDIRPFSGGLSTVLALRPASFYRTDKGAPKGQRIGLIAEDVARTDPRMVAFDDKGKPRGWDQAAVITALVGAVQEQQREIAYLKARVH